MKNKLKRIVSLVLIVATLFTSISGCGDSENNTNGTQGLLTRGQWIAMLSKAFCMDSYEQETPYYKDVTADNEIFGYVQSCYEWDVLSTGTDEFKPNDIATLGFVITTAVLAAELEYEEYNDNNDLNAAIIKCAKANGVYDIEPGDANLNSGVTEVEAAIVMNAAVSAYVNATEEEHIEVDYKEGVIDASNIEGMIVNEDGTVVMPESGAANLEVGSVFYTTADAEHISGAAYKVVSKTLNPDGTYSIVTEKPQLGEVLDYIDMYSVTQVTEDDVIPLEGVTLVRGSNEEGSIIQPAVTVVNGEINDLSSLNSETTETLGASASASTTLTFEFDIKDKKSNIKKEDSIGSAIEALGHTVSGELSHETNRDPDYDAFKKLAEDTGKEPKEEQLCTKKLKQYIEQYQGGLLTKEDFEKKVEELKKEYNAPEKSKKLFGDKPSYKAGYSLTGSVEIKVGITADVEIGFGWFEAYIEELSVKGDLDVVGKVEFEGKMECEVDIAKVIIPIGGIFSIDGVLKAYVDVTGNITFKVELDNDVKITYDNKFKASSTSTSSVEFEAGVSVEFGPKISVILSALGYELADVTLSAAGLLEAKANAKGKVEVLPLEDEDGIEVKHWGEIGVEVKFYAPVVKVAVGDDDDTLLHDLGIKASLTIISKEDTPIQITIYENKKEMLLAYEKILFSEEESSSTEEESTENETTSVGEGETTTEDETDVHYNTITFDEQVYVIGMGEQKQITPTLPAGYTTSNLRWSSSDASVVSVVNGNLKGGNEGTATITVTTDDGLHSGQIVVIVEQ